MNDGTMAQFQNPGQMAPITPAGQTVTQSFGGVQTQQNAGTADSAVAAQVKAQVEARYIMALRMPRDMDTVRINLLKECRRPGFANSARYSKPVGRDRVEGWSIRFAETAGRIMRNLDTQQNTIFDDDNKRIIRVTVTDLEANTTYSQDLVIEKTVERSQVRPGQTVIRSRTNSQGRMTYIVQANEGDLANKEAALVSKSIRNLTLRMIPGDITEDALDQVRSTIKQDIRENPDAARLKIIDAFAQISIEPKQLAEYVGCELKQMTPADIEDLRTVYSGVKTGEVRWREVMENKKAATAADDGADHKGGAAAVRNKIKARGKKEESPTHPEDPKEDAEFEAMMKRAAARADASDAAEEGGEDA